MEEGVHQEKNCSKRASQRPAINARNILQRLECPVDDNANYQNDFLTNRDLIPMPDHRRKWNSLGFAGYWIIAGINTTPWTIGSSLLALGLSVGQAMAVVVAAAILIGFLAVGGGWPGSHQHIGFPVLMRSSWGIRGAVWPVLNRVVTGTVWMGIQMYWGGQCVKIILGAIIGPRFVFLHNTLPPSANVDMASLISFFVFVVILAPLLMIRPERLQTPFRITSIVISVVLIGMLIWALAANRGAGTLVNTSQTVSGKSGGWNAMYGLSALISAYSTGALGQSDWTRYARTPNAALFGQAITAPLTIIVTALFGILITSATSEMYGSVYWSPFELLLHIQQSLTPSARAGTFFAGLGLLVSQAAVCIVINSVAAGMDLANLLPKYINLRRGSYIIMLLGIAICPWIYVNEVTTFLIVLSGWGVFISPMMGVLVADYYILRRRTLCVADLYIGNVTSAYWYIGGFNPRTALAWTMGVWPLLPGFVRRVRGTNAYSGWDCVYDLNYFLGFLFSFTSHILLHGLFSANQGVEVGSTLWHSGESELGFTQESGPVETETDKIASLPTSTC